MKNKVKESIDMRIRWYKEGQMSWEELKDYYYSMQGLLHDMWRNDLISDAINDACAKELYHNLFLFLMKNQRTK